MTAGIFMPAYATYGSGYSFELTAESQFVVIGYARGTFGSDFGYISKEPIPGSTLREIVYYPLAIEQGLQVGFSGNVSSKVSGKVIWVDGTKLSVKEDWNFSGGDTFAAFNLGSVRFTNNGKYWIEIK